MPPPKPSHISPTLGGEEALTRGIAQVPDAQPWTEERWASFRPAIEIVLENVQASHERNLNNAF